MLNALPMVESPAPAVDYSEKQVGPDPFAGDKMFRHLDRLAAWQAGELPPPVTVELDLTWLCNHACPGCTFGAWVNVKKDMMPLSLAVRLVGELADFGVRGLTFSGGGEPLLWGQDALLTLAGQARERGLDTALITNGSLLTPEEEYAGFSWVRVSLDAYDPETFSRFHGRGPGEFRKVVFRLADFARERERRWKQGLCWPTVGVGFLTDKASVSRGDLYKMARFCAGIPGLDYLQFRPLVLPPGDDPSLRGGMGSEPLNFRDLEAAYRIARTAFERDDFRILWSHDKYQLLGRPDLGVTYSACHAHFLQAAISAEGKVYICCHGQGREEFCLGDLNQATFPEVWHSERARLVRRSIRPAEACPPACRLSTQNTTLEALRRPAAHVNFL
jgi:radical SAM protein with 4Fe4S-binding SPASM domain